ncbi:hypothetical protein H8D29_06835 [PVC group bacterium]|nr:hypothetical protein [PVC group bacterium]
MDYNNESIGIPADDVKAKQYVLVSVPLDEDGDPVCNGHWFPPGKPYRVEAVSWPWVMLGFLMPGGELKGPMVADLRKIKCMRVDDSYVNALKNFKKKRQPRCNCDKSKTITRDDVRRKLDDDSNDSDGPRNPDVPF